MLPCASAMRTCTGAGKGAPTVITSGGGVTNSSLDTAPASASALNVALTEAAVAVMLTGPAVPPSVASVCAVPFASVSDVTGSNVALPAALALQLTREPATGFPNVSVTRTTSGLGSVPRIATACASPES